MTLASPLLPLFLSNVIFFLHNVVILNWLIGTVTRQYKVQVDKGLLNT